MRWIAIPNIASFLVGLQGIGLVLVLSDPRWWSQLALVPQLVLEGEVLQGGQVRSWLYTKKREGRI